MTVKACLENARVRLLDPENWKQYKPGENLLPEGAGCLTQTIERTAPFSFKLRTEAYALLAKVIKPHSSNYSLGTVVSFNDDKKTTHPMLIAVLDQAIKEAA